MRIWIISDIHKEGCPWHFPEDMRSKADVVLLAGDVHRPLTRSLAWLAQLRGDGPLGNAEIVMVAGNHEFYGADLKAERAAGHKLAQELGIHFLNRSGVTLGGVLFLGCTLWTDYGLLGQPGSAMAAAKKTMNDHELIRYGVRRFEPSDALNEHHQDRAWLERALAEQHVGPTVVVTHHGVSKRSVHARWATDPLSAAFSSNLDALVEDSGAALWVHGHTHDSFDYTIGNTRVVCNPKGYGPMHRGGEAEKRAFDLRRIARIG